MRISERTIPVPAMLDKRPVRGPICAIINPVAGHGRSQRIWEEIRTLLHAAGMTPEETLAQYAGQAWEASERAVRDGAELIVAVGGDGTLHETLNGLMHAPSDHRPALVFVPGGTANIFARALGLPSTAGAIAQLILTGTRKRIDVGQANDRYFATIAGVGFDAEVVGRAVRWRRWAGSKPSHAAGVLAALATYRAPRARVILDGREIVLPLTFLAAANTEWYGAGLRIAPHARPDDARLSVVYAKGLTRGETLVVLLSAFSGRHLKHPKVAYADAGEVQVDSETPLAIHADGEWLGRGRVTFRIVPRAVDLIVPHAPWG